MWGKEGLISLNPKAPTKYVCPCPLSSQITGKNAILTHMYLKQRMHYAYNVRWLLSVNISAVLCLLQEQGYNC